MLAARCFRLAAVARYAKPSLFYSSTDYRRGETTSLVSAARFSIDRQSRILISYTSSSSFELTKYHFSTIPESCDGKIPSTPPKPVTKETPPFDSSSKSKPSSPQTSKGAKSFTDSCANVAGASKGPTDSKIPKLPIDKPDIKLPSRDQIESFVFKTLVYLYDFAYYVFCWTLKFIEQYIINNPTVQKYWKQFVKRMDDARQQIKK